MELKSINFSSHSDRYDSIEDIFYKNGIRANEYNNPDGGTGKNVLIVKTDEGKRFVVKLFNFDYLENLNREISLLRRIGKISDKLIFPLQDRVIIVKDKCLYIYEYFDGIFYKDCNIVDKDKLFGKIIADYNILFSEIEVTEKNIPFVSNDSDTIISYIDMFKRNELLANNCIYDIMIEGSKIIDNELKLINQKNIRKQLIHKDLHPENLIYNKKTETYKLIDTAELDIEFLPKEITNSLSYFLNDKLSYTNSHVENVLKNYLKIFPLNKDEIHSIPLLWLDRIVGVYVYFSFLYVNRTYNSKEYQIATSKVEDHYKFYIQNFDKFKTYFQDKYL